MLRCTPAVALAVLLAAPMEAARHRFRVFSNPEITILSIAQGPDGFLWLAAADGLYRFDGFHYHQIPDFPFSSARSIGFTKDGSIWVGSSEGLVRHTKRFEVLLRENVLEMAALSDQVFVKLGVHDLVRIRLDGAMERRRQFVRHDLLVDSRERLWFVSAPPSFSACVMDPNSMEALEVIPLRGNVLQTIRDVKGQLWAADSTRAIAMRNGVKTVEFQRRPSGHPHRASPLLPGRNGQLWFIGEDIHGTNPPVTFRSRETLQHLDVTAAFEDSRGHLWVAVPGRGLVEWTPDSSWERWFPEAFDHEWPMQTIASPSGIVAATDRNLYRLDPDTRKWMPVSRTSRDYLSVFALSKGGFLAAIRDPARSGLPDSNRRGASRSGIAVLSPAAGVVEWLADPFRSDDYREIQRDGRRRIWVGHGRGILQLQERPESLQLLPSGAAELGNQANVDDLEIDADGKLWIGYYDGIAWLDEHDRWHRVVANKPLSRVRTFAPAGHSIWVAYEQGGRFSRLDRSGAGWEVRDFTVQNGFGPPETYFLKRDSRGWIWRGSTEGVYVSDGRNVAPHEWLHIHLRNGLATGSTHRYGFFEDADGGIWITGEQGITHMRPETSWFDTPADAPPIQITRFATGVDVFLRAEDIPESLSPAPEALQIELGSLSAPAFRDLPFRYRLLPVAADWRFSRDGTLAFEQLPEGAYSLEVAYVGNTRAPPYRFTFRLGPGAAPVSRLWLLSIPVAAVALALLVRRVSFGAKLNYRTAKAFFLLRRCLQRTRRSPGDSTPPDGIVGGSFRGRYQVVRVISRGGFSVVYETRDVLNGCSRVAVKILDLPPSRSGWVRERFAQEVAALRTIEHPGVIRIHDSWIDSEGHPCLAMPFVDGPTLRTALLEARFTVQRTALLVMHLGDALSAVHQHGIVHRDLKPENIILLKCNTDEERPVLIDFGAAGLRGAENELAATTLLAGSFHYLAPERLTGHYSPATDVYAFGVIILEVLTGKRLSDLSSVSSDFGFIDEVTTTLASVAASSSTRALAQHLSLAYSPEPRQRPKDVRAWATAVAALLQPDS